MAKPRKLTTAALGSHHVRWLCDEARREGDVGLVGTCDLALSAGVGAREVRQAQKIIVDEINRRAGHAVARASGGDGAGMRQEYENKGYADAAASGSFRVSECPYSDGWQRDSWQAGAWRWMQEQRGLRRGRDAGSPRSKVEIEREIDAVAGGLRKTHAGR